MKVIGLVQSAIAPMQRLVDKEPSEEHFGAMTGLEIAKKFLEMKLKKDD
jgi:hypothetical protein